MDYRVRRVGSRVQKGLFVEVDSHAIASFRLSFVMKGDEGVTRWGLFLMRGVHFQIFFYRVC